MKWSEYYAEYDGWTEHTQYSRVTDITDFGPKTSPSFQIADCVQNVDDRTAGSIITLAARSGVRFSGDEVVEILERTDLEQSAISALINSADESTFSAARLEDLLNTLCDETPALPLIDRICGKPNDFVDTELVSLADVLFDEERSKKLLLNSRTKFSEAALLALCDTWIDEDVVRTVARRNGFRYSDPCEEEEDFPDEPINAAYTGPKKKGIGLLDLLIAAGAASAGSNGGKRKHNGRCDGDCANCPPHYGYRYGRWYYGHGHMYGCEFGGNRGGGGD